MALLNGLGLEEVKVVQQFDCFRATTKERSARKYGVRAVNVFARKR